MRRILLLTLVTLFMAGCATKKTQEIPKQPRITSPATTSQLEQGKRLFQDGFYKRAMEQLLPIAAEGNMEAQYAVGYMYYYGFGAAQDTESGNFWIRRSADQNFGPAIKALAIMQQEESKHIKVKKLKNNEL
jgi:TPR repeat protein